MANVTPSKATNDAVNQLAGSIARARPVASSQVASNEAARVGQGSPSAWTTRWSGAGSASFVLPAATSAAPVPICSAKATYGARSVIRCVEPLGRTYGQNLIIGQRCVERVHRDPQALLCERKGFRGLCQPAAADR